MFLRTLGFFIRFVAVILRVGAKMRDVEDAVPYNGLHIARESVAEWRRVGNRRALRGVLGFSSLVVVAIHESPAGWCANPVISSVVEKSH